MARPLLFQNCEILAAATPVLGCNVSTGKNNYLWKKNSEFGISEALAVVKRRFWWILVPALIGPVIGIGLTFVVRPIYTSKAFVLIEQPKVPDKFVTQVITDQLDTRLMTLQEQILSRSRLEPIVERLGLYKNKAGKCPWRTW